ncbi:hypothetical protein DXG01_007526 [Tephrocybe rancida]|nr:hypothetical protein DXG01_007526 [Tephrocybe rancida]
MSYGLSFGYTFVNVVLGEVRDPVRTVQRAAPLALFLFFVTYIAVNVGYFAVVAKGDVLKSGRLIAALFFRNLFGPVTERMLSMIIAMSILGNTLAHLFVEARLIQELGRDNALPMSSLFASTKPFDSPFSAMALEYVVSVAFMLPIDPGDAYTFLANLSIYSVAITNLLLSSGLLLLRSKSYRELSWNPPFRAPKSVIIAFIALNGLLIIIPLIPPTPGTKTYEFLPYWLAPKSMVMTQV